MLQFNIEMFALQCGRKCKRCKNGCLRVGRAACKNLCLATHGLGNAIANTTTDIVEEAVDVFKPFTDKLSDMTSKLGEIEQLGTDVTSKIADLPNIIASEATGVVDTLIPELLKIKDFINIFSSPQKKIYDPLCVAFYDITGMTTCKAARDKDDQDNA